MSRLLFSLRKHLKQGWWCTPSIWTLKETQAWIFLCMGGQVDLHSEFQTSQATQWEPISKTKQTGRQKHETKSPTTKKRWKEKYLRSPHKINLFRKKFYKHMWSNFLVLKATPLGEQSLLTLKFTCIVFFPNTKKYCSFMPPSKITQVQIQKKRTGPKTKIFEPVQHVIPMFSAAFCYSKGHAISLFFNKGKFKSHQDYSKSMN